MEVRVNLTRVTSEVYFVASMCSHQRQLQYSFPRGVIKHEVNEWEMIMLEDDFFVMDIDE